MDWLEADEELRLIEAVQTCGVEPWLWPQTLALIEREFRCKAYLLEFSTDGYHTARYCSPETAADIIDLLNCIQAEADKSALAFLLFEAPLNYPYCKMQLLRQSARISKTTNGVCSSEAFSGNSEIAGAPGAITPLIRNSHQIVLFACVFNGYRPHEIDQKKAIPSFQRLARAITSSLMTSQKVERLSETAGELGLMVAYSKEACALVTPDLTLALTTPSFDSLLQRADVFEANGGRLAVHDKGIDTALVSVAADVSSALHTPKGPLNAAESPPASRTLFVDGGMNRLVRVVLNGHVGDRHGTNGAQRGYVHIQVTTQTDAPDEMVQLLRNQFHLSQREAHLAHQLATNGSIPETMHQLGITRNTVKTHLRRIYEKTGTQSQLELANLLHGLCRLF